MLRWVWLLTVVVSQNVTGGTLATIMVSFWIYENEDLS